MGILNTSGTEVVKYTYDAWGKVLSTGGSLASTLGAIQPFRYRGYVYDVETGLYYLRTRYYNPQWERFINADALINGNLFAYCSNNPIIYKDSNGTSSILVAYEIEKFITALFVILDGYLLGKGIEKIYESNLLSSPSSINQKDINYQHVDGLLYSSGVMDGIGYAVQRARTQESAKRSNGFQIHHIVPWKDNRCENARNVLEKAGINPKKDERNQITIPTQLHKFLNTDAYDIRACSH